MSPINIIVAVLMALAIQDVSAKKHVVSYYGSWSNYRAGDGRFVAENIPADKNSMVIYTFVGITSQGDIRIMDPWLDLADNYGLAMIDRTVRLKKINPSLKVLVAIGGWNEGSENFSIVAKSPELRKRFAKNALDFCLTHGFDGFDMDWEYPAQRGGAPEDKENFVYMLADLREALAPHNLLLTAAVAASESSASISYDIPGISKYLDYILIMTYDFHGSWNPFTGHNAPLFPGAADLSDFQQQMNVDSSIQYWLREGAPPEKIILGVAFYGRSFTLSSTDRTYIGAPANGPGVAGPITQEAGFLGYNEVCARTQARGWTYQWIEDQHVPISFSGNQWIGYDDSRSLFYKANHVHEYNLAGVMLWSIETDDFNGICGEKFPLLNTLNIAMEDSGAISTTPQATEPTATESTSGTTTSTQDPPVGPPGPNQCERDGYFRDPKDCTKYFHCEGGVKHEFTCSGGLYFDETILQCNWPHLVDC